MASFEAMLLLPEGCLVRLLLPLLFLLRELDEADVEADLNSSDNTTVIEGQLKEGKLFVLSFLDFSLVFSRL